MRFDITHDGAWDYKDFNEYRRALGLQVLPDAAIAADWRFHHYSCTPQGALTVQGFSHFYRTGGGDLEKDVAALTAGGFLQPQGATMLSIDCRAGNNTVRIVAAPGTQSCDAGAQVRSLRVRLELFALNCLP
jgi:hypothetical protein